MRTYIKNHKIRATIIGLIVLCIAGMAISGTLSYPYILIDRQIELRKYCAHGGIQEFDAPTFGFHISAPSEYCVLPHRIFPEDTSIQIVPTGNYSVINEYGKSTIINATRATLLFEHLEQGRSPEELIAKMRQGGFLQGATEKEFQTKQGLHVFLLENTGGLDGTSRYSWAFILHPDGKSLLSVLTEYPEAPDTFNYIINNLSALK